MLDKVSGWLLECLEGKARGKRIYERSPQPKDDFLPRRLIEISFNAEKYQIRLVDSKSLVGINYAALSYCWGGDQPLKTTAALLDAWKVEISWGKLPNTLKEAVVVCSKIQISYLWIDALCIVQDDLEEMAVEIAQMANIYHNSTVTVAVARAASVDQEFLEPRTKNETTNPTFEIPFQCSRPTVLGSVTLIKISTDPEPLDTRGWTLQERLLAPRTLEFGTLQTRFFCQHNPRGFTDGWTLRPGKSESRQDSLQEVSILQDKFNSIQDKAIELYSLGFEDAMNNWLKLVEVYTHRHLTVSTDRILAISGIAERYGSAFGGQYCAGIWQSSFPRALFWTHSDKMMPRPRVW
ncbi:heterokaryon incompatibility protein-domain-containing protein [Cadophora sp. MPI-SDFR-AT-0126]|nr:heterokaryon incompatibility protein-domain-containing protein [Leotiomycetes sp. MPI-SDFR-AT-0126]